MSALAGGDQEVVLLDLCREPVPEPWLEAWRAWRASSSHLGSPYFAPEFALAAAEVRSDTRLLVVLADQQPVLFLPLHLIQRDRAIPVGGALNDYHGPVARPDVGIALLPALRAAGISRFDFHSWFGLDPENRPWAWTDSIFESAAEWGDDVNTYLLDMRTACSTIRRQGQKTRKMIRELGPLRLESPDPDPESFDWLIDQKRRKYWRTGCTDFFAEPWTRGLLRRLHATRTPELRGHLSILYAGSQRVAGHFGIANDRILHYWFPCFDLQWGRYSPGTELYLRICQRIHEQGIRRVEFGYGSEPFKLRIANRFGTLAAGRVGGGVLAWQADRLFDRLHRRIRRSRLKPLIRDAVRTFWPSAGKPVVR